jgi:septum formation protein
MKKKVILASSSPTRKIILSEAGLSFEIIPSDYEEDMSLPLSPYELAKHLSRGKAESVANVNIIGVVIGADTFVVYEDKILGKPYTADRAKEMLNMLSGKKHLVITGFTIIDKEKDKTISRVVETNVFFRNLSSKEIDEYVATGEPLNKAGSYGILENGWKFIEKIEGSKSNIAGLPIEEVMESLKDFEIII